MRSTLVAAMILTATVVAAGRAAADGRVEERHPVDADAVVTIKNLNGVVTVEGWDKKELEVTGTITGDVEEVVVTGSASHMRVEARFPENRRRISGSADLRIRMPAGGSARVHVVNADITVGGVSGEIDLEAVNGDIEVSGKPQHVDVKTVNGDIAIRATSARVEAETVGGRVTLDGASGDVAAASVGGDIVVSAGRLQRARFTTVSGTIDLSADLAANATLDVESHSGDALMRLPAAVSAEFDISSFSGDIDNEFGPAASKKSFGMGRDLSFATGGGDAQVSVNTFSGDVRLLKK